MTRASGRSALRTVVVVAVLGVLAGCTPVGGLAPGAGSDAPPRATPSAPPPTAVPIPSSPGRVPGGGSQPDPGGGGPIPVDPGSGGGGVDPQPTLVAPVAGLLDVHPVSAVELVPSVVGHRVSVRVAWWSGVEPCNVLAGVDVARDGDTFRLTVAEGAARRDVACPEIAVYKATVVDLGELPPGDYTISARGEAAPVAVIVPG
jgi:hypothetical protein